MIGAMLCRTFILSLAFALSGVVGSAMAADPLVSIEKSVVLIEKGQHSLARSYLAPALVDPRISSAARSRAYYLRGFSFASVGMPVSALRDFNRALEFNPANPAALFAAARSYWDGVDVEKDEALALGLFAQARELGHLGADLFIALGHLYGRGVEQNTTLGRERLTDLAADGNALAMSHLASSLRAAAGRSDEAADWYREAFAAGDPNALVALAFMYLGDELTASQPLDEANALLQQAAAAGSHVAMVRLAHHYLSGAGLPRDYGKSQALFTRASALGNSDADVGLGYLYQAELVAAPLDRSAGYWYQRAAYAGNVEGQLRWGRMLLGRNKALQARSWFAAAARQNSAAGHNNLAWLLATFSDAGLRDGARALMHAQLAVEAQPSSTHLDTLAAAYAETGLFDRAVATQQQALAALLKDDAGERSALERRLSAYRKAQPWRE